ncbi:MAG: hypothetical protein HQK96_03885 [Nitrospirae bacterium]|nr:hypothetical protein [Nitrospirota bacterium]
MDNAIETILGDNKDEINKYGDEYKSHFFQNEIDEVTEQKLRDEGFNAKDGQIVFDVEGDGTFNLNIKGLYDSRKMVDKQFPTKETSTQPKPKVGKMTADRESELILENLKEAKRIGNDRLVEMFSNGLLRLGYNDKTIKAELDKVKTTSKPKPVKESLVESSFWHTDKDAPEPAKQRMKDYGKIPTGEQTDHINSTKTKIGTDPEGNIIYEVDGEYIRQNIYNDFNLGGNDMAYPNFIPKGEIWIDKETIGGARETTIAHEVTERKEMFNGKPYLDKSGKQGAHIDAIQAEKDLREGKTKPLITESKPETFTIDQAIKNAKKKGAKNADAINLPEKIPVGKQAGSSTEVRERDTQGKKTAEKEEKPQKEVPEKDLEDQMRDIQERFARREITMQEMQKLSEPMRKKMIEQEKKNPTRPTDKDIKQKAKGLADKIRAGKLPNDITLGTIPFAKELINRAIEVAAKTVELGGTVAQAIEDAIKFIKDSDWYKKLSDDDKEKAEYRIGNILSSTEGIRDPLIKEANANFEKLKDKWIGDIDVASHNATVEAGNFQTDIQATVPRNKFEPRLKYLKRVQAIDNAIHFYIDIKNNPSDLDLYDKFTPEQKKTADLAQNLKPEQKDIADNIAEEYKKVGQEALDNGIIHNVVDNYVARAWDFGDKPATEERSRFATSTRHSLERSLSTIAEGWSKGYDLKVKGATNNLAILKQEIANVIANKELISEGSKVPYGEFGSKLFSTAPVDGYSKIENLSFKKWGFAGKLDDYNAEDRRLMGKRKDILITEDGNVMQKQDIYAPSPIAKRMNNILGESKLKGLAAIDAITKFNAYAKSTILFTSLFHHLAFTRNHLLAGEFKNIGEINPVAAYKKGLQAIYEGRPEVEMLVRNGLTMGKMQDYEENLLEEKTAFGKRLDKMNILPKQREAISHLFEIQRRFLFEKYGAGLKAIDGINMLQKELRKHPERDPNKSAKIVATFLNDNYGGLHLKRMERNPTWQHVMRLTLLASDWTESNIRMAIKAFKKGDEANFYRAMWGRVFLRGATTIAVGNLAMALIPDKNDKDEAILKRSVDRYKKAWKDGNLDWTKLNITALAHLCGADPKRDYYFPIFGHYSDPARLVSGIIDPRGGTGIKFFVNKGSVISKIAGQALTSQDWKGETYTTIDELLGLDDKGKGKKARLGGKLVKFSIGGARPVSFNQLPSYALEQVRGVTPTQIQNLTQWWEGEIDAFTAITNSAGMGVTVKKESKKKSPSSRP